MQAIFEIKKYYNVRRVFIYIRKLSVTHHRKEELEYLHLKITHKLQKIVKLKIIPIHIHISMKYNLCEAYFLKVSG